MLGLHIREEATNLMEDVHQAGKHVSAHVRMLLIAALDSQFFVVVILLRCIIIVRLYAAHRFNPKLSQTTFSEKLEKQRRRSGIFVRSLMVLQADR